jgi:hypothetical protein
MQAFLMHVGHPGNIDIAFTVTRERRVSELMDALPDTAAEKSFSASDPILHGAFPDGKFHCWGIPGNAEPRFRQTEVGDLVLFAPQIGIHDGGIHHLGIVRAKCPVRALAASQILWPETPHDRLYPLLFFFRTESGVRGWYDFLADLGYKENWNPLGWYRHIADSRFSRWGGPEGYLRFLRDECGFRAHRDPLDDF